MGNWGTAIFSDDLAADLRSEFRELIGDGLTAEEATRKIEADYVHAVQDDDEAPVFWISLALTQHRMGRPMPHVLAKAIELLDGDADLLRWDENPKLKNNRKDILDEVKAELLTPPPKPKRVPKRFRNQTDWTVGQVIAYQLASGSFCAFHVIGHREDRGGRSAVVTLFDWIGPAPPREQDLTRVGERRHASGESFQMILGGVTRREFPAQRLIVMPFTRAVSTSREAAWVVLRRSLDDSLSRELDLR